MDRRIRFLFILIAILLGVIVALVAGILTGAAGNSVPQAILTGGTAFAGTVTLALLVMSVAGVFDPALDEEPGRRR
ncbi:hypothetical protein [Actinomadura sp. 9N407]|uniref:hypothetical protein n=1 Tax=Actinomadura sp. 9N407 TaxID=3375154 RepID=UPI0037B6F48F